MRKLLVLALIVLVAGCIGGGGQKESEPKGFIATYNFTLKVDSNMNGVLVPLSAKETKTVVKQVGDRVKLTFSMKNSNIPLMDSYITPEGNFTCVHFPAIECMEETNPLRPPTQLGIYLKELEGKGHIELKGTSTETINGFECEKKIYKVDDINAYLDYLNFNKKSEALPIDVTISEVMMIYCEKDEIPVYYSTTLNAIVNQTSARNYLSSLGTNESKTPIPKSIISNITYVLVSLEKNVEIPTDELTPPTT